MALPTLLRGAEAIGRHIGESAATADQMHRHGRLPTFRVGGTPYATTGALDEWRALLDAAALPTE